MRIVLIGAVQSTRVALETMCECGERPSLLVTLPLSKAGRHSDFVDLRPHGARYSVPIVESTSINSRDLFSQIANVHPDFILVIGWSQIIRREFFQLASGGIIGYHPAPLPKFRGRAVIPWTILEGETETASTLFWIDDGVDSGDILCQVPFAVQRSETAASLYKKHLNTLRGMLKNVLPALREGVAERRQQDHSQASFCARRRIDDGLIDWRLPAEDVWTLIRASTHPYPGAFTFHKGKKLAVWEADLAEKGLPFVGTPGQVQALNENGALVQCGDRNHVLLKGVQLGAGEELLASALLKLHDKLTRSDGAFAEGLVTQP